MVVICSLHAMNSPSHVLLNLFAIFQFSFARMFNDVMPGTFSADYKCYSVSMMQGQNRKDVEKGGKSMSTR